MSTRPTDRSSGIHADDTPSTDVPHWVEELGRVTHDLRSPLASISGYADLLHRQVYGQLTSAQSRAVESIHRRCGDLGRGLERFSDWIYLESGTDPGSAEAVDLIAIAQEYVERAGEDIVHIDASSPIVAWAPIGPTTTVVRELLHNAVAAAQGRVEVQAKRVKDHVFLLIGDDGPGPPDPDQALRPESGLARCRRWLDRIDGRLDLIPREKGGTIASIELPSPPRTS